MEVYFLRRAFHLIGAGNYNVYLYLGSRRDAIGQDPSQYGLELETRIDPLLQKMGLALDASYNVRYTVMDNSVLSRMKQGARDVLAPDRPRRYP